jgi:hypothetical protein
MNPISDHELLTLRQIAAALGVAHSRVRSWADRGNLDVLQPSRNVERLVPVSELRRLEREGFRVNWAAAISAIDASPETLSNEGLR